MVRELRVLELAGSLAGAYCGRLFAVAGAHVVLAEPPEGAPTRSSGPWVHDAAGVLRSATHEYLDTGKRSVVLARDGAELDDVLRWADLVISTCDGDPEATYRLHQRVVAADPSTVHAVASGFGLTGPYARWRSTPLVDWAAGGYLYVTGEPDREPLNGGGPWGSYLAGATLAVGAQVAVMHAARTGEGQLVDVGAMEAIAHAHQWSLTMYTHTGAVKRRWGRRFGESFHPMGLYQCGDGRWISVGAASRDQWENFCITTDTVELMADESLYAPAVRFERADEIDALVAPWLSEHTATEAVAAFQENRVPASEVLDFAAVLRSEQLAARQYLESRPDLTPTAQQPGRPFRIGDQPPLRPPRPVGADTSEFRSMVAAPPSRPPLPSVELTGVRMLEFTIAWAGPLAARILGDLGVDVVKVEHPASRGMFTTGPQTARAPWHWGELAPAGVRAEIFPDADPGERRWNRMGVFNKMNRSKRSLSLDAKAAEGAAILDALIGAADLVVHNYTPRGAASLGIAPERLAECNSRIASVAMSGYGETGPMAMHSSYGPMLEAYAGFAEATGYMGEGPMRHGLAFPDAVGGVHGAFALLAALWERELSDGAVHVDMAQLETLLGFAGEAVLATSVNGSAPPRRGNRSVDQAPQGVYASDGDDSWIALAVPGTTEWRTLLDVLDDRSLDALVTAELADRIAAHDAIDDAITRWTTARTAMDAARALQDRGIPACPAFTNRDLVEDEHIAARGFIATWDQPDVGRRGYPGSPFHFERSALHIRPAPTLGQDNRDVLRELHLTDVQIDDLYERGVVADRPPPA